VDVHAILGNHDGGTTMSVFCQRAGQALPSGAVPRTAVGIPVYEKETWEAQASAVRLVAGLGDQIAVCLEARAARSRMV